MCGGGGRTNGEVVRSYRFKFHIVKVGVEPPCIPQKLPYAKVFDRTHGAPLCLSDEGEFKPLRPGWGPKREESGLQKQVTLSAYFPQSVSIFTSLYQVHTPEPTYAP